MIQARPSLLYNAKCRVRIVTCRVGGGGSKMMSWTMSAMLSGERWPHKAGIPPFLYPTHLEVSERSWDKFT
jgi:hypothetical protein